MATFTSASLPAAAAERPHRSGLIDDIRNFWREFVTRAFNPYRPELHYMRGPGPAWRAKYGSDAAFRLKADLD
ncbi:conserved hypothetical protein [Bradyrhizobium sp. ORS 278]|uniref:hypothetical protein n=1 Tax=Bradyrhizobium sp. (strain ORS 278) TaxID=114615 RepID=UPI00015082AF|nr:hypothetical protein [Bradyrhizobium sp. ORS 278]CAL79408.1 conserved hypothetical protein [Bradyrhizobium sp. ORS 278]